MPLALITGASSGIGLATASALASRGFHVVAAGRSTPQTLLAEVERAGGSAEFLALDLASLDSVREAARRFADSGRSIEVLVNNAGIGARRGVSADGFEIHFAVNHLGHFLLTHHLQPSLRSGSRIVTVTSSVHFRAKGIDFERLRQRSRSFYGLEEYAVSKLANVLFTREMARRLPDRRTYAVHPGLTDTGIFPWYASLLLRRRLNPPQRGAETVVWCATSPEVANESGAYYSRMQRAQPSPQARDEGLARELWARSEEWCNVAPSR